MDKRAAILDRLEELLGALDDSALPVFRNRADLDTDKRPCFVLLDGSETVHHNFENRAGRVYAKTSPSVMMLEPEIFALLKARIATKSEEYAPEIASYRNSVTHAILNDTELNALTGDSGDIVYRGAQTDMHSGMTMQGELQLLFRFYYVLDPTTDLA